jgi:hypothetical protein
MVKKAIIFLSPGRASFRNPPPLWMKVLGKAVKDPTAGEKATSRQGSERRRRILGGKVIVKLNFLLFNN